jgi:hypothetical protein
MLAMFTLCPPGNLLWASDSPYGRPLVSAVLHLRFALQAGLGTEAIRAIAGAQLERLLDGGDPLDAGPPPGEAVPLAPLLERVVSHLNQAIGRSFDHGDPEEPVALARLACAVGADGPHAELMGAVLGLLDEYEDGLAEARPGDRYPDALRLLVAATSIARTPDVPLPDIPEPTPPTGA